MRESILVASVSKLDSVIIETWAKNFESKFLQIYQHDSPQKMSTLRLHIICFQIAVKIAVNHVKYDKIIFWQQLIGIYYGFLSIFFVKGKIPATIILTFIYNKRSGFWGSIHKRFVETSIETKYITKIVCHSRYEIQLYKKVFRKISEKFQFCLLGEGTFSELLFQNNNYYFSGGKSNRDYKTIIETFNYLEEKLVIACTPENIYGLRASKNISIHFDAYGIKFLDLIKKSKVVIILVNDINVSAGQLVLLNALRFGKPLIVTNGNSMSDYINNSYCITVEPHSTQDLGDAIKSIEKNPYLLKKMGEKAFEAYNELFTIENYGQRILKILNSL